MDSASGGRDRWEAKHFNKIVPSCPARALCLTRAITEHFGTTPGYNACEGRGGKHVPERRERLRWEVATEGAKEQAGCTGGVFALSDSSAVRRAESSCWQARTRIYFGVAWAAADCGAHDPGGVCDECTEKPATSGPRTVISRTSAPKWCSGPLGTSISHQLE